MNTAKKVGKSLLAYLLTVCLLASLVPAAFADNTPDAEPADGGELHIADVGDVPEGGSFDAVYVESSVGSEDVVLKGIEAEDLVVQGGKSLTLDEQCSFENISMQHDQDAFAFVAETGAQVKNLLVESAKAAFTVKGNIGNLEIKSDNADVTVESGNIDNSNVSGKNAKLTIGKDAVSATLTVLDTASDSKIVVQGSVVTATAEADNTNLTVEDTGSVAILSTGENTKDATFQIGGIVGHVVVTENSSGVKVNVTVGANVTAIGAAASVEINVDDGATVSHLVSATDAVISGNVKADDIQVKDDVVSNGIVNFTTADTTPAQEAETAVEKVADKVVEVVPDWAVAKSGRDYYTSFQDALYAEGNVTLYAGQIFGNYQVEAIKGLTYNEVKDSISQGNIAIDMWSFWGMEGMVDAEGNECPQFVSISDETKYRDTAVADTDAGAWVSAKYLYEYYVNNYANSDYAWYYNYYFEFFLDTSNIEYAPKTVSYTQVFAPYSQAIDLGGNTLLKTDGNGNGLRLGSTNLDKSTDDQTFYVSNGKFIGEKYTYDYDSVEDKTSYDPTAWVDKNEALTSSGNLLNMRQNSTYIIDNCDFENGYVQLNLGESNVNSKLNAVYFDECSFDNTLVKVDSGSYSSQKADGYEVSVNFNDCSFTIDDSNGQIRLSYYIWGNVNFSNCDFTVNGTQKAITVYAYAGSNANHELAITFENCTLNGETVTTDAVNNSLVSVTWKQVTTVYVDNDGVGTGEEAEVAINHNGYTTQDQNEIGPESAETNTLLAEAAAEDILGVEILTDEEQAQVAALSTPEATSDEQEVVVQSSDVVVESSGSVTNDSQETVIVDNSTQNDQAA